MMELLEEDIWAGGPPAPRRGALITKSQLLPHPIRGQYHLEVHPRRGQARSGQGRDKGLVLRSKRSPLPGEVEGGVSAYSLWVSCRFSANDRTCYLTFLSLTTGLAYCSWRKRTRLEGWHRGFWPHLQSMSSVTLGKGFPSLGLGSFPAKGDRKSNGRWSLTPLPKLTLESGPSSSPMG